MQEDKSTEKAPNHFYARAKHLLEVENKTPEQTINILIEEEGLDNEAATKLVKFAEGAGGEEGEENDGAGVKDMLIGGLFCVGGIVATVADIGYIFWGAIVFGGIQFIKGAIKAAS